MKFICIPLFRHCILRAHNGTGTKDRRGQFVRKLTLSEKVALLHVFSTGRKASVVDIRLANNILDEMDKQVLWIKCDCVEPNQDEEGPFNCEVNAANLRHVSKSKQHDEHCPLYMAAVTICPHFA